MCSAYGNFYHFKNVCNFSQNVGEKIVNCWEFPESGAVQKLESRMEKRLEKPPNAEVCKSCKSQKNAAQRVFTCKKSALMQKRTSPPKSYYYMFSSHRFWNTNLVCQGRYFEACWRYSPLQLIISFRADVTELQFF